MNNFNRENSAWCITDGSAGMISQVKGLALAMNLGFTLKEVKVNFPWSILPVGTAPIIEGTFSICLSLWQLNLPSSLFPVVKRVSIYPFF